MIKTCFIILFIFLVSLFFASDNKAAFGLLETNTPGILGAILGGMIAGISIIFVSIHQDGVDGISSAGMG